MDKLTLDNMFNKVDGARRTLTELRKELETMDDLEGLLYIDDTLVGLNKVKSDLTKYISQIKEDTQPKTAQKTKRPLTTM